MSDDDKRGEAKKTVPLDDKRDRLLQAILKEGGKMSRISNDLGCNHAYMHQYIVTGHPRFLKLDLVKRLAPMLGLNPADLAEHLPEKEREKLLGPVPAASPHLTGNGESPRRVGTDPIPVYGSPFPDGSVDATDAIADTPRIEGDQIMRGRQVYAAYIWDCALTSAAGGGTFHGALALVDPTRPPRAGDLVMVRQNGRLRPRILVNYAPGQTTVATPEQLQRGTSEQLGVDAKVEKIVRLDLP